LRSGLTVAALAVVGAFLVLAVVRNWAAVRSDLGRLSPADYALSALWGTIALIAAWGSWALVVRDMGARLGGHDSRTVFFAAQLGKYVPGSVWPALIQARMGRIHGVGRQVMVTSYLYALAVSLATGGLVGLLALVSARSGEAIEIGLGAAAVSVCGLLLLLHPRGVIRFVPRLVARFGRDVAVEDLDAGTKVRVLLVDLGMWVAFGLHAWAIARPLGAGPGDVAIVMGGFALAYVGGVVVVPLPGGAGVREAILILTIGLVIGRPGALTLALISRFVLIALEVLLALATGTVPAARAVRGAIGGGDPTDGAAAKVDTGRG
jgi:hypothetical protein